MKSVFLALATIPAVTFAQTLPPPITRPVIAPIDLRAKLPAPPPCLLAPPATGDAIIGEKGRDAIIGEEGSVGIIGEDGSAGVIGEDGSNAVIGEKSTGPATLTFGKRWQGSGFTQYNHVLVGRPGQVNLDLYGCSSASGGETVAVYLADANGRRKTGWRHFVIATRNGNSRMGTLTLPKPPPGQALSRLPIVVVVENASGKPHVGEYRLTVSR